MSGNILKTNKIPGREQLTRPSEIDALSKYLGEIRRIQDEHTKLEERVFEVKGRGDKAFFPEVKQLSNKVEELVGSIPKITLDNTTHEIPVEGNGQEGLVKELDNTIIKPEEFTEKVSTLDDSVDPLEIKNNPDKLDDSLVSIIGNKNHTLTKLDDSTEKLTGTHKNTPLDNTVVKGEANKGKKVVSKLDNSVEQLNPEKKVSSLNDKVTKLEDVSNVNSLDNEVVDLNVGKSISFLDNNVTGIISNRNSEVTNLDNSTVGVSGNHNKEVSELDNSTVSVSSNYNEEVSSLSDYVENLEVTDIIERLSSYRSDLAPNHGGNVVKLDESTVDLKDNQGGEVNGLDKKVINIDITEKIEKLDNSKESLEVVPIIDSLGEEVLGLEVEEKIDSLDDYLEKLKAIPKISRLDDSVSSLKLDRLVEILRGEDDVDELEVEALIDGLVSDAAIGVPYDYQITRVKKALEETKDLNTEEAFSKVISLFRSMEEGNAWIKKISSILTEAFLHPGNNSKVPDTVKERERYKTFLQKLSSAAGIAEVAAWESLKQKQQGPTLPIGSKREHRDIRDRKKVPKYRLPDNRLLTKESFTNPAAALSALTAFSQGNLSFDAIDYARREYEELLDKGEFEGDTRSKMLQAALRTTERTLYTIKRKLKMEPTRLPGDASSEAVTEDSALKKFGKQVYKVGRKVAGGIVDGINILNNPWTIKNTIANFITTAVDGTFIKNRPETDNEVFGPRKKLGTENYDNGNIRQRFIDSDSFAKIFPLLTSKSESEFPTAELENSVGRYINFKQNYLSSEGIQTTLVDLCKISKTSLPSSFEELQKILRESPYITTPGKFSNTEYGEYRGQSLSVTNYWEILIEPFVNEDMNGGFSYLPAIHEINLVNQKKHGVNTGYNTWIPITGFDLTTSRMVPKSAALFDGEIVFPIGSEYANELRITIADDVYKSWTWYFKTVMEVSVYSSIPHDKYYYEGRSVYNPITPTFVDHTCHCVALYKNITFNVRIYIMTPQYSTIKSFDLLCVMKDWTSNFVGDVDSGGGGDLSISFSIVGENPDLEHNHPAPSIKPRKPVSYSPWPPILKDSEKKQKEEAEKIDRVEATFGKDATESDYVVVEYKEKDSTKLADGEEDTLKDFVAENGTLITTRKDYKNDYFDPTDQVTVYNEPGQTEKNDDDQVVVMDMKQYVEYIERKEENDKKVKEIEKNKRTVISAGKEIYEERTNKLYKDPTLVTTNTQSPNDLIDNACKKYGVTLSKEDKKKLESSEKDYDKAVKEAREAVKKQEEEKTKNPYGGIIEK